MLRALTLLAIALALLAACHDSSTCNRLGCNNCPFDHGGGRACSANGSMCEISGFEHDCECTCSNGNWSCVDLLAGQNNVGATSHCPYDDAGVPDAR